MSQAAIGFAHADLPPESASRPVARAWPPPPHDPRERELAMTLGGWEVRLFAGRKFQYFVTRGFWHLQLWHPGAGVSILTPSRLTNGLYEAFPVDGWKLRSPRYEALRSLISELDPAEQSLPESFPSVAEVEMLSWSLVKEVVRTALLPANRAQ